MTPLDSLPILLGVVFVFYLITKKPSSPFPPGPKGFPVIGSLLDMPTTYPSLTFANWSEKWGEYIRAYSNVFLHVADWILGDIMSFNVLGRRFVILNSAQHAIDILEKKSAIYSGRATVTVGGDMIGWSESVLLQPHGEHARNSRRLMSQIMGTTKRVEQFHRLIEDGVKQLLVGLAGRTDAALVRKIHQMTGSIVVQILYGYKSSGDGDRIIQAVDKAMDDFKVMFTPGAYTADAFPLLRHVPDWLPGAGWKRVVARQRERFWTMVELPFEWVKGQMAAGIALPSFSSTLLEGNTDPEKEDLVKMTAATLYAGASDTIVASITKFFLAMACFPEVQRKAQAELDAVIGQDNLPGIADKDRLPYIHALVLEILRWLPAAPLGFPHRLDEDDSHDGYFLPKGSVVIVNVEKILHDPSLYADPMTFNPERFIATSAKEAERDPHDFAFGFGRRKCPGNFFAEASIFAAVAETLAIYSISKATDVNGDVIEPRMETSGMQISHPLPFECQLTVRSDKAQALLDAIREEAHVSE